MEAIQPIIKPEDLVALNQSTNIVLIDASAGSKERYNEQHLSGAIFADVNNDLANIVDFAKGGRHPLPTATQFSDLLGRWGIIPDSHVIIYDDKNGGNAAARLWWMLKAIGHQKVQVIDGGYNAAIQAGFPANAELPVITPAHPYTIDKWNLPTATIDEVESATRDENHTVIDVRDASRYAGLTEPIDLIAGHIPGAVNIPFTENLDEKGRFLSPEILRQKYTKALSGIKAENTIVHCGSGITACHTLLAMDYAGLPIPKLYVGSWSEWSRNNKPMNLAAE